MKKNKGITLIALIITIIILIILTAITINNVIGTDLIGFATKAVENYTDAAKDEADKVDKLVGTLDNQGVGEDSKVRAGEIVANTEKDNYTDAKGKTATIPQGFKVSTKSSEQYIDDGLVIQDSDGNEFVWIPCTTTQYEEAKDDVIDEDWSRWDPGYTTNGGGNGKGWRDDYIGDDKTTLDAVYTEENSLPTDTWIEENQITVGSTSIGTYGGFYIARYEAGIPEEANFYFKNVDGENNYANTENKNFTIQWADNDVTSHERGSVADTNIIKDYKPVSKQGMQAWNYITQPNAKMVAENMYKERKDSAGNAVGVKSYLVDSQAWNHICKNIYRATKGQSSNDSTAWGNYNNNTSTNYESLNCLWATHKNNSNTWTIATKYNLGGIKETDCPRGNTSEKLELSTGASDDFKRYNIYDMAGNMFEWTTGHNVTNGQMFVVPRGGSFHSNGAGCPVVRSQGTNTLASFCIDIGFRVVLYIQ